MNLFDILGPIMIGPSSSHTAGAARIGNMARTLLGERPVQAKIHLHGSFAQTGSGHGTDRALVGGLLGMKPDDLRIPFAFEEAEKAGLQFTIDSIELRDAHPNTAVIELTGENGAPRYHASASMDDGEESALAYYEADAASTPFYATAVVNPGESLLYQDGKWQDWVEYLENRDNSDGRVVDNFPIKAYLAANE